MANAFQNSAAVVPKSAGIATGTETKVSRPTEAASADWPIPEDTLRRKLAVPSQGRLYFVRYALKMGWIETEHAVEASGSRFAYLMREAVQLEFALVQYAMNTIIRHGFIPVITPPWNASEIVS